MSNYFNRSIIEYRGYDRKAKGRKQEKEEGLVQINTEENKTKDDNEYSRRLRINGVITTIPEYILTHKKSFNILPLHIHH